MKPVSLEGSLTELHTSRIEQARETIEDSTYALGRVGLIYSGQMYFDFEEPYRDPPKVDFAYLRSLHNMPDNVFMREAS